MVIYRGLCKDKRDGRWNARLSYINDLIFQLEIVLSKYSTRSQLSASSYSEVSELLT